MQPFSPQLSLFRLRWLPGSGGWLHAEHLLGANVVAKAYLVADRSAGMGKARDALAMCALLHQ